MFCPNCGSETPDGAVCCPNCGKNLNNGVNDTQNTGTSGGAGDYSAAAAAVEQTPEKKGFIPVIIAVAAVAVIVLIIIFKILLGGSYKDPIRDYVKLLNKQDHEYVNYFDLSATKAQVQFQKKYVKIMGSDNFEYWEDEFKDTFDEWEDEYGSNFKIKVEFDDVDKIDKDDLKDKQEDLREAYEDKEDIEDAIEDFEDGLEYYLDEGDISKSDKKALVSAYKKAINSIGKTKIQKGYELDLIFKIKGKDGDAKYRMKNVEIYKINGKWVVDSELSPSDLYFD